MNIERFNINNLPLEADSYFYPKAIIAERERVCGPIDKRIDEMEQEFSKLVDELYSYEPQLNAAGFWQKFAIQSKIQSILKRINQNRSVRQALYTMRLEAYGFC